MRKYIAMVSILLGGAALSLFLAPVSVTGGNPDGRRGAGRILIVYHGGTPPWRKAPPPDPGKVDALTQATTEKVNVRSIAEKMSETLTGKGYRVMLRKAVDIEGPDDFIDCDGIIFGTPTWFSNVAYPLKKVFDEHLIRIYEHRPGRLNDKVLAGLTTVMESGKSGPHCLESLRHGMEHLSTRIVDGIVVHTYDDEETVNALVADFCRRFSLALE